MVWATIEVLGDEILATCYAEGKDKFTMVIDMTDFTVKQCSRPQDMYSVHVLGKIVELYERTGNIPKEMKSVWF